MSNEAGNVRCCDQMHDAKQNKKHSATAKYSGVSRCRHKQLQLLGPKLYLHSHCFRNATRLMKYGRKAAITSGSGRFALSLRISNVKCLDATPFSPVLALGLL